MERQKRGEPAPLVISVLLSLAFCLSAYPLSHVSLPSSLSPPLSPIALFAFVSIQPYASCLSPVEERMYRVRRVPVK